MLVTGNTAAVPGLIDAPARVVTQAPNLRWSRFPAADRLRALLELGPVPVSVGNDASLAAIAEYRVGGHAGTPDLIYITGEVGIGGGIIVAGRPRLGVRGFGGEIGHMKLDANGPLCGCGRRGCWEALIGLGALLRSVPPEVAEVPVEAEVPMEAAEAAANRPRSRRVSWPGWPERVMHRSSMPWPRSAAGSAGPVHPPSDRQPAERGGERNSTTTDASPVPWAPCPIELTVYAVVQRRGERACVHRAVL